MQNQVTWGTGPFLLDRLVVLHFTKVSNKTRLNFANKLLNCQVPKAKCSDC